MNYLDSYIKHFRIARKRNVNGDYFKMSITLVSNALNGIYLDQYFKKKFVSMMLKKV